MPSQKNQVSKVCFLIAMATTCRPSESCQPGTIRIEVPCDNAGTKAFALKVSKQGGTAAPQPLDTITSNCPRDTVLDLGTSELALGDIVLIEITPLSDPLGSPESTAVGNPFHVTHTVRESCALVRVGEPGGREMGGMGGRGQNGGSGGAQAARCSAGEHICGEICVPDNSNQLCENQCPDATQHNCGGTCRANDANACGAPCTPCPKPLKGEGTPSCDGIQCGVDCTGATPRKCETSVCIASGHPACCGDADCTSGPPGKTGECIENGCQYKCMTGLKACPNGECRKDCVIYVATTGNANNPGTVDKPLRSIQDGVDRAASIGLKEVRIGEGIYSRSNQGLSTEVTSGVKFSNPILASGGWNAAFDAVSGKSTLDGLTRTTHVIWISSSDVTLRDLVVQNGRADTGWGGGIFINGGAQTVKNVLLEKITVDSCYSAQGAAVAVMGLNVTLRDSIVTRNSSPMGAGAMTFTGRGHTAIRVTIENNSGQYGTVSIRDAPDFKMEDSAIRNNETGPGSSCFNSWACSNLTLKNNTFEAQGEVSLVELGGPSGDVVSGVVIEGNTFTGSKGNLTYSVAIVENYADIVGHTIVNNRFNLSSFAGPYRGLYKDQVDSGSSIVPASAVGLAIMNSSGHSDHDATTTYGNVGF